MKHRELSLEERTNLLSVIQGKTIKGDDGIRRYQHSNIASGIQGSDRTLDRLHSWLDSYDVPRFTNCPFSLNHVVEHLDCGKRLDAGFIHVDGRLGTSSDVFQVAMLNMALEGNLRRITEPENKVPVWYKMDSMGETLKVLPGDLLIRSPEDYKIYHFWVCPARRAQHLTVKD